MKPEELMLGDIVLASGKPIHVTLATLSCKVDVKPMPLTEEMLVKSGFPRDLDEENKSYWDDEDKDKYRLYKFNAKYPYFHLIEVIGQNDRYFWVEDHCTIKIHYVHEFQHLLKLCGIEKEIIV